MPQYTVDFVGEPAYTPPQDVDTRFKPTTGSFNDYLMYGDSSRMTADKSYPVSYYSFDDVYSADQFSSITVYGAATDTAFIGPLVRCTLGDTDQSNVNGYLLGISLVEARLMKITAGVRADLSWVVVAGGFSQGDVVRLEASGSNPTTLKCYKNGVLIPEVGTDGVFVDSTSPFTTGYVAFGSVNANSVCSLTVWSGGDAIAGPEIDNVNGNDTITQGQASTVNGTSFGATQGTVSVGGANQTVTSWTDTQVQFTAAIPNLAYGFHDLVLTDAGSAAVTASVAVVPATGRQYIVADVPWEVTSLSLFESCTPAVVDGDQLETATATDLAAAITLRADGTFIIDSDTGTHTFTARCFDQTDQTWGPLYNVSVTAGGAVVNPPVITTTTLNALLKGTAFTQTLVATGDPQINWTADSNIPAGLSLALSTGVLSGTPTVDGAYNFTVTATNAVGSDAQVYAGTITSFPVVTTTVLSSMRVGVATDQQLEATGVPAPTFTTVSGLPTGLGLSSSGRITGTPSVAGPYSWTVRATNSQGTDDQLLTGSIAVAAVPPTITTTTLGPLAVGTAFSQQLFATGDPTITFATQSGTIPAGLSLSTSGLITGTPTTAGAYSWTVRATNGAGFDDQLYTGSVTAETVPPTITTATLNAMTVGSAFNQTLAATGDQPMSWTVASGTIVPGLTLSNGGVLSGTPTTAGAYDFTVRATNGAGNDTQQYTGSVNAATVVPIITTVTLQTMWVGVNTNQQLQAIGAPIPTWDVSAGTLPVALTLDASGLLYGVPTLGSLGAYDFTVRATNSAGNDTQRYTGAILEAPAISQDATLNDAMMLVTGGPTFNDGLMALCRNYGAVAGSSLNDAQMQALAAQGFSVGDLQSRWMSFFASRGFATGDFNDRMRNWLVSR